MKTKITSYRIQYLLKIESISFFISLQLISLHLILIEEKFYSERFLFPLNNFKKMVKQYPLTRTEHEQHYYSLSLYTLFYFISLFVLYAHNNRKFGSLLKYIYNLNENSSHQPNETTLFKNQPDGNPLNRRNGIYIV